MYFPKPRHTTAPQMDLLTRLRTALPTSKNVAAQAAASAMPASAIPDALSPERAVGPPHLRLTDGSDVQDKNRTDNSERVEPTNGAKVAPVRILVVDDDALVRETFAEILEAEGYAVTCVASGAEALTRLAGQSYDVMLCDMFMPGQNGLELLSATQSQRPDMPVILITAFGNVDMAREALQRGASDFITKPCGHDELPIVVERNLTRQAVLLRRAQRSRQEALVLSNETVLDALLSALNTRDTETQGHSERVTAYTIEMAERLGIYASEMYHIERGALLHDIGKIGIPDRILLKPGKLTEDEWSEMRKHPVIGYDLCARIEMLRDAADVVLHHHEAWNGSGYPGGLAGAAIPLGARLFAIADTLDAMTSDRPYRQALSWPEARDEIVRFSGKMFDPDLVKLFLTIPPARWQELRALTEDNALTPAFGHPSPLPRTS